MKQPWTIEIDGEERTIYLVPKSGYLSLPLGTELYSIDGEKVIVGEIDLSNVKLMNGYLPYGVLDDN